MTRCARISDAFKTVCWHLHNTLGLKAAETLATSAWGPYHLSRKKHRDRVETPMCDFMTIMTCMEPFTNFFGVLWSGFHYLPHLDEQQLSPMILIRLTSHIGDHWCMFQRIDIYIEWFVLKQTMTEWAIIIHKLNFNLIWNNISVPFLNHHVT